ncbi:PilT/PilU family type 4a pilus ATPase [Egibacter rhizosphaerae]|uniref:PilT/PilU family type 4a pilus ATPase n=1 Tax=Egibacter rhizosphaerae TaxID=1670831 RepID=A0A411YFL5_9ACTN|nr:PilT/PilU family type 4a pilus ATPase [Egibacter rhizosphaerae]QBI20020.1 PilT/PilU family type 4a pilus ATPase [Egibacter rhizosphaerae]
MPDVHDYLRLLAEKDGSDLHVKAAGPAHIRIDGDLSEVGELPELSPQDTADFARQLLDEHTAARLERGEEIDLAYSMPGVGRFRVAVFTQRGSVGLVFRRVLQGAQDFDALGLPAAVRKLAEEQRGLVLVTGPTGSGKTTTSAAMISHINKNRRCHIVSVEDPIEILHRDERAIVDQREVGIDTRDFTTALRSVARMDPDVIFVGEMRDLETVRAALQAAETGHLVLSTLHTQSAAETINRVIDLFPPHQQQQTRLALANTLKGIVSQRLLPRVQGGRIAAIEVLVMTTRLYDFVVDPDKSEMLEDAIAEGEYYGMQTFDQHLLALYRDGVVTLRDALGTATSPHDFRVAVRAAGLATA